MDWRTYSAKMAIRLGPALLVITCFVSLLLGLIFHAIKIDELQYRSPVAKEFNKDVIIGDKLDDLVWFLQISDLHISYKTPKRVEDFSEFAKQYVDIIKPDAVLVTGDITDGRIPDTIFGSSPQISEWQNYSDAIKQSGALDKTVWLDIRGNHDNFNVYRPKDPNIFYRKYSVQGKNHERNYMYTLNKGNKKYSFIGVDEVQTPGLKIPFNFLGIVNHEDLTELKQFKDWARGNDSEYTVWFAHYPTSSIVSPNEALRSIVDGPYLCGHYHTIGNLVTKMHASQQSGFAEVELGDWKYNRVIRLAAVDHQLFSLVDVKFREFPIALMTNPKTAEHAMPKYEPVERILNSTHIRVLAFSNSTITKVTVSIDGSAEKQLENHLGPLYTLEWKPRDYEQGLHQAQIKVFDSEGKQSTFLQTFSMDNTKEDYPFLAKLLLRAYFKSSLMTLFYFTVTVCVLPLLALRFIGCKTKQVPINRNCHYRGTFLFNMHLLSKIDGLFYWLVFIPLWVGFGPMFIGYLVDDAIGVCFVWGVLIDAGYVHTGITFNVGSIFLLLIHMPIGIMLANQVGACHQSLMEYQESASIVWYRAAIYALVSIAQVWIGVLIYSAYGLMSYLTCFPFLWTMFIYLRCFYLCLNLDKSHFADFQGSECQEEQALTGKSS